MRRKWLWLLSLLAMLALTGCARQSEANSWPRIERSHTVVVGLDDSFVPMGFRQKNGQLAGYDIDLAKAVFKRYDVKVDFQTIEWSMKETELKNQTIDLIWNGYTETAARKQKVAFSDPYLTNHQVLVTKTKAGITSAQQMQGKTLGVQTGSSGADDLDQSPKVLKQYIAHQTPILYDTFNNALIDLDANRIQGLLMDEVYARYYVAHEPDPKAYRLVTVDFPAETFAVGLRKSDTVLRQKINQALAALQKNGTTARLQKKWFGQN
ncbi:amino acid ABC transporter substrate-binding protein [Lacticaseibacillus brantae]|uniref:Amino acid ABC transporter periplasmic protein n=1 Tax=Lacticaseibacillus brantae DSM 23927 TaxID=1423727 RepID=A0A0R2BA84_9LACO|nr:amino acid ABC transporter substrate-binding protein [Lacticaseibacillus brantae]KRM72499.1 amino acid ABC transporter periplasmic protein [Lacticaseibacillus brantae DSM 23927]